MIPNAVRERSLTMLRSLSLASVAMMFVLAPVIVFAEEALFVPLTPSEHSWFERESKPVIEKTEGVTAIQFAQLNSELLLNYIIEPGLREQPIRPIAFNLLPSPLPTTIVTDRVERSAHDFYHWTGHIEGEPNSLVALTVRVVSDGDRASLKLLGLVIVKNRTFRIHQSQKGAYVLVEIDTSKFPPESPPKKAPKRVPQATIEKKDKPTSQAVMRPLDTARIPSGVSRRPDALSEITEIGLPVNECVIDVAVAYTPEAEAEATSIYSDIVAEIDNAIFVANITLRNSDVVPRLRLVATSAVKYHDSGDLDTDHTNLENAHPSQIPPPTDPLIPVHRLRDDYKADLVALWVQSGTFNNTPSCGLSTQHENPDPLKPEEYDPNFSEAAFSVVPRSCALSIFSMAHEFGHLMGAHHDRQSEQAPPNTLYSYGYVHPSDPASFNQVQHWMTIMGENMALLTELPACPANYACCSCSACGLCTTCIPCSRQTGFWSNPKIFNNGARTGVPDLKAPLQLEDSADNHRALNASARTIASFRNPSPDIGYCEGLNLLPPAPPTGLNIQ